MSILQFIYLKSIYENSTWIDPFSSPTSSLMRYTTCASGFWFAYFPLRLATYIASSSSSHLSLREHFEQKANLASPLKSPSPSSPGLRNLMYFSDLLVVKANSGNIIYSTLSLFGMNSFWFSTYSRIISHEIMLFSRLPALFMFLWTHLLTIFWNTKSMEISLYFLMIPCA